jgi:tRNA pseudouridine55 synthase
MIDKTDGRNGFLLLNKRTGVTSFDSLKAVKKAFGTGKVGHTGTLDKFASGLLLVLVGRGVKTAFLFSRCVKEYIGTIRFGEETDTLDPEGEIIARGKAPSLAEIEAVLPAFRGNILQAPPAYSAVHINGCRAHELARKGQEPEIAKRPVTIHELEILSWVPPDAEIRARVSAGTYIRSLSRDIALAAGSRAFLVALRRTGIAGFSLEEGVDAQDDLVKALLPLDAALFERLSLPYFLLEGREAGDFIHGGSLEALLKHGELRGNQADENTGDGNGTFHAAGVAGVFRKNSSREPEGLLGILEHQDGKWKYVRVFAAD